MAVTGRLQHVTCSLNNLSLNLWGSISTVEAFQYCGEVTSVHVGDSISTVGDSISTAELNF